MALVGWLLRRDPVTEMLEALGDDMPGSAGTGCPVATAPLRRALTLLNWKNAEPEAPAAPGLGFMLPGEAEPANGEPPVAARPLGEALRGMNWANQKSPAAGRPAATAPRGVPVMVSSVDDVMNQMIWD